MKFAVTPFSIQSIPRLIDAGAHIFIMGNEEYANRLVHSFSTIELQKASTILEEQGKDLYIALNIMMHNQDVEDVKEFFLFLKNLKVSGIIFGEVGVYEIAKEVGMEDLLIYNPETLNTNSYDPVFWKQLGIKGLTISKEITLEDLKDICKDSPLELSMIGHGHLNMFHSRRPLIENFFKYQRSEYEELINNRKLRIVEEIRNESYPIFQDRHGTHIFRDKALESFREIREIKDALDVFIIDGIFKDTDYLMEVMQTYQRIVDEDNQTLAEEKTKEYKEDHDSGFLYKKTVYDKY
jgi:putative protease